MLGCQKRILCIFRGSLSINEPQIQTSLFSDRHFPSESPTILRDWECNLPGKLRFAVGWGSVTDRSREEVCSRAAIEYRSKAPLSSLLPQHATELRHRCAFPIPQIRNEEKGVPASLRGALGLWGGFRRCYRRLMSGHPSGRPWRRRLRGGWKMGDGKWKMPDDG